MTAPVLPYAEPATVAATLRRIADAIETVDPNLFPRDPYVSIDIQPGTPDDDRATVAIIDTLGMAILGQPGTVKRVGGSYHHHVAGVLPGVHVSIYDEITSPEKLALQAEIDELRRQRDALLADDGRDHAKGGED